MKPKKLLKVRSPRKPKVDQGDIFSSITFLSSFEIKDGRAQFRNVDFDDVLVLSQTCDLNREYEKSGSILSVLVVPLFPLEDFINGRHLAALGISGDFISKKVIERYRKKEHYRFRVLDFSKNDKIKYGLRDSFVIDFRYFFTIGIEQFGKGKYKASLNELFREDITAAFSGYLSRIGLPDLK